MRWSARLAAVLVALLTGCHLYDDSLVDRLDTTPDMASADASVGVDAFDARDVVDASDITDVAVDAPPVCAPAHPPARPTNVPDAGMPDAGDGGVPTLIFAVHSLDFRNTNQEWVISGYDLDNLCTMRTTPSNQWSCMPRPEANNAVPVDGDNGRDDAFNELVAPLFAADNIISNANDSLAAGRGGILLWVQGLDGDDDADVQFGVVLASAGHNMSGTGMPAWDGHDVWDYDPHSFVGSTVALGPLFFDMRAYATGGTLVAHLPPGHELRLPSTRNQDAGAGVIALHFVQLELTAQITRDPTTHRVTGLDTIIMAGVWSLGDARNDLRNAGICPNTTLGGVVFSSIAAAADMISNGPPDPTAQCDGVSATIYATASVAQIGAPVSLPPASDQCM